MSRILLLRKKCVQQRPKNVLGKKKKSKHTTGALCNENENFVHSIAAAWWIDGTA